ncbi:MAG TPA: hypothetical protein VFN31_02565 [Candidatus Saccharimonadales bacterium]|nr:hypothetical protein [Candidatus Saccharimonadales bacterium]
MDRVETRLYDNGQPANFTLSSAPVPALTIEQFNPNTATENYEIVRHTIAKVQARKRIELLQEQFALEANLSEINYSETRGEI